MKKIAFFAVLVLTGCTAASAPDQDPAVAETDGMASAEPNDLGAGRVDMLASKDLTPPTQIDMTPADSWPLASSALEDAVLAETNKRRIAGSVCNRRAYPPVPALTMVSTLQQSARLHSKDMADHNYFSHTGLDGSSPFDRMKAAGFSGSTMAENIAAGGATAAATVAQWIASTSGHCESIMDPKYKYLGVGYAYKAKSRYKYYWTQNFGG